MLQLVAGVGRRLPGAVGRGVTGLAVRGAYAQRIERRRRVPSSGPLILLANDVEWPDALLLLKACPRKPLCVASWPAKGATDAVEAVREALRAGKAVCVLSARPLITEDDVQTCLAWIEARLPEGADVPIVPVHLALPGGSAFRRPPRDLGRRPAGRWPYPATIVFGEPFSAGASPRAVRLVLAELATEAESLASPGEGVFPEAFTRQAHQHPFTKIMADSTGDWLTYLAVLIRAHALAGAIRRELRDEETHVGVVLPTCTSAAVVALAVMFTDRVPVFLNFTASRQAQNVAVERCGLRRVYTSRAFLDKAGIEPPEGAVFLEDVAAGIGPEGKLRAVGAALLPARMACRRWFPQTSRSVHQPATVLFSSGSTGMPKGAVLTHHNFTANASGVMRILGVRRRDRLLGSLPLFHSFGYMGCFWLPLLHGIPAVYHANPRDAVGVGEAVEKYDVAVLFATPTFIQGYARKCTGEQLGRLRLVITGAEKLRSGIAEKFAEVFGVVPIEGYGTTELSPVVSVNMPRDLHDVGRGIGQPGAVGRPLPGIALKTVDPSSREPLGQDEEGVLLVKGPNVMKGYLDEPEKTAEVLVDGWYDTGDMAKLDSEGYLHITGRLSRFSKIGGEMVPHLAVEEALHQVLGRRDDRLVVTGIPDDKRGERLVVLHCPLQREPAEVVADLRHRGLPNLWIPKPADFHPVEAIPLLGSGKLDLKRLQDLAREFAEGRNGGH